MAGAVKEEARRLLAEWKGDGYVFGLDCMAGAGGLASQLGRTALMVSSKSKWMRTTAKALAAALAESGVQVVGRESEAGSNAPREDVYRVQDALRSLTPDLVVATGGGSTIDCVKAAAVLATLQGDEHDVEPYFGVGKISEAMSASGRRLPGILAVQCASGSGAHLTKYSNITDLKAAQKKLIIDEAIVPPKALFDYKVTCTAPRSLTSDGALDGIAHLIEVYYGAKGETLERVEEVVKAGVELIVSSVLGAVQNPEDPDAREGLGLGTDLGGHAIMIGGTNGAHLTSFSLVDVLAHGRACALMNPYYTVFFAPAIERQLRVLGEIYKRHGYIQADVGKLRGRDLGVAVGEGMLTLSRQIAFPTTLSEVPGFTDEHIGKALSAAKNPQLESKLKNMPVPLSADTIDDYMGPILRAAETGDFSLIKNMS